MTEPTQRECDNAMVEGFEQPRRVKTGFLGLNANIIKPEQSNALKGIPLTIHPVKKVEQVPNKPLEQPKCKTCKGTGQIFRRFTPSSMGEDEVRPCKPEPSPYNAINKPEQPNTELLIVKTIQGLTTCINNELEKLVVLTACMPEDERKVLIIQALANIDSFEKTTLFELQKAFE